MTKNEKDDTNRLARIFYKMHGYNAAEGYDFSAATHPQERSMFNLAEAARMYFEPRMKRSTKVAKRDGQS